MEAKGIERSTVTYTGLINACAEGGQLDKAMALFTYMEVAGVERNPVTYCVAINGCTRNGQWEVCAASPRFTLSLVSSLSVILPCLSRGRLGVCDYSVVTVPPFKYLGLSFSLSLYRSLPLCPSLSLSRCLSPLSL